jgi:four helix bundle protein
VPANTAEGCVRGGGDLQRFCHIAAGSVRELEYRLLLAHDLELLDLPTYDRLEQRATEVERLLAISIDRLVNTD